MFKPKLLLHLEGAAVLFASGIAFEQTQASWWWFALLLLTPDLFMFGYLVNQTVGAAAYNFVHTYTVPLLLFLILWLTGRAAYSWLALIWLAHIGMDRMLGFGLKYATAFKDTHLNRV